MKRIAACAMLLLACACATPQAGAPAATGSQLDTDVHGFAMAYCLRSLAAKNLPEPEASVVRDQGNRWSQIVVENSRGDFTEFFVILPALNAAIASRPMAYVRDEETGGSAAAPVYYCDMLLREPAVVRAMDEARRTLAPAYTGE